jgi:hypothetical protein
VLQFKYYALSGKFIRKIEYKIELFRISLIKFRIEYGSEKGKL